jgi:hypothetical protein
VLGRAPDANGLALWQAQLAAGTSLSTIQAILAFSPEETAKLTALYTDIIGQAPTGVQIGTMETALSTGTPLTTVVAPLVTIAQNEIPALYVQILNRPADAAGLAMWQSLVPTMAIELGTNTPITTIRADLAYSPEAQNTLKVLEVAIEGYPSTLSADIATLQAQLTAGASINTTVFATARTEIAAVYQAVLGRAGDAASIEHWVTGSPGQDVSSGVSVAAIRALYIAANNPEIEGDLTTAYQAAYGGASPTAAILTAYETELGQNTTLAQVTSQIQNPVINGTVANQAIDDQSTDQLFAATVVTDPNIGASEAAVVILKDSNGNATDADGTLSGAGLTKIATGTYTLTGSSDANLTAELDGVTLTPTAGLSATTNVSLQVTDSAGKTTTDTTTSINAQTLGIPSTPNYIYSSGGSDALVATAGTDIFAFNANTSGYSGNDVITGFDPTHDIIQLSTAQDANFAAVTVSNVSGGAQVQIDHSSTVLLQGVDATKLTAANFNFVGG